MRKGSARLGPGELLALLALIGTAAAQLSYFAAVEACTAVASYVILQGKPVQIPW